MRRLDGRVAVVTGGASGIGRGLAEALGGRGCKVVVADVEVDALDAASAELRATGVDCLPVVTDVSSAASVDALLAAALDAYGAVHVLCNNAGVRLTGSFLEQRLADWEWMVGVHLWGLVHGLRTFLPILLAQDEGHVVNTASIAGVLGFAAAPYVGTKHAVVGITDALSLELQQQGAHVGVSLLCPGAVRTNLVTSQRNRPAELRAPARPDDDAASLANMREAGIEPAAVGALVVSAIENDRYLVLTHPDDYAPLMQARVARWLSGQAPEPVTLGPR
jgi:NAD(P)-dependent dehydrogenase (short-subunit alcohol dehydrogenase family)